MLIYIMRHGDALMSAPTDAERPLSEHGKLDVAKMASHLKATTRLQVLVSPYKRAQQTADLLLESFVQAQGNTTEITRETFEGLTPEADPVLLIRYLEERPVVDTLIVSHQPFVGSLASLLIDGAHGLDLAMTTSSMAKLESEQVGLGLASLIELARPW